MLDDLSAEARARIAAIAADLAAEFSAARQFAVRYARRNDRSGIVAVLRAAQRELLAKARERIMAETTDAKIEMCRRSLCRTMPRYLNFVGSKP